MENIKTGDRKKPFNWWGGHCNNPNYFRGTMEYLPIGSVLTSSVNVGWGLYAAFLRQQSLLFSIDPLSCYTCL